MNKLVSILLAMAIGMACPELGAQTTDLPVYRNEIGLSIGLYRGYFRDRNFSPLNYRSSGFSVGLSYTRHTAGGDRWHASLGGIGALLNTGVAEYLETDRYVLDLSFGYQKAVTEPGADRRAFVGLNYRSYVDLSLYDGAESITFFALHALEIAGSADWKTGDRHRLKSTLAVPVVGLLSRPPYTGWDKFIVDNAENIPKIITRGTWTSLHDFFGLRASLGWEYRLGKHWAAEGIYSLSYYATDRLDAARIFNHQFSFGVRRQY